VSTDRDRRFRPWTIAAIVVVVAAVLAAAMTALVMSGSSQGSAAVEQAQRAAAPGVAVIEAAAARRGETLRVSWSTVPDPGGKDLHMVTARFELRPSGQVTNASFIVSGTRVVPQDALARRLIGASSP
jgi:hypothetical protein